VCKALVYNRDGTKRDTAQEDIHIRSPMEQLDDTFETPDDDDVHIATIDFTQRGTPSAALLAAAARASMLTNAQ